VHAQDPFEFAEVLELKLLLDEVYEFVPGCSVARVNQVVDVCDKKDGFVTAVHVEQAVVGLAAFETEFEQSVA
jgi:hypothetical protein